ncbi:MAG: acyl-CoA dehydrogenase family protein [Planctomycetota bacterium]|nr:acyl-CoA dehydrogenase family protein [Planctomycetota bacterium]
MANFYSDNEDIQFLFEHMNVAEIAAIMEDDFSFCKEFDYAPENSDDAVDNYRRILTALGELAGDVIAPTAEHTDQVGNVLNEDGSVTYAPGIDNAVKQLAQADAMGFTLPYRFGGLNCPNLIYTMSNEIVSRADASLMNIYGLQGIAETINAFASDEIKQQYLPPMASGQWTGAMVLTEPDAGSDLQAVKVRAYQDDDGNWFVSGVKRFITNGCGEVLLVLARSEPEIADGRGLSLLLVERGPQVKIRRLEEKLGIHGSPTCEIFFDSAPAKLIGERQRGLITYVMSLMNGARIGIAAQSIGIGEAVYRVARDYAHSRKQFDTAIENFPAVRELLVDMSADLQAARAITYYAAFCVDLEYGALRKLHADNIDDAAEKKRLKQASRTYGRYNKLLTPMSKYYASEMSMRLANSAMAVLGGSGYMKDYPVERHLRDSRITTIYEGTTQLQVLAAVAGVISGTAQTIIEQLIDRPSTPARRDSGQADWPEEIVPMIEHIRRGLELLSESVQFIKARPGVSYRDLYARKLVDIAIYLTVAALFCDHATVREEKKIVAKYWLARRMPEIRMLKEQICSGDEAAVTEFEALAGPVPVAE